MSSKAKCNISWETQSHHCTWAAVVCSNEMSESFDIARQRHLKITRQSLCGRGCSTSSSLSRKRKCWNHHHRSVLGKQSNAWQQQRRSGIVCSSYIDLFQPTHHYDLRQRITTTTGVSHGFLRPPIPPLQKIDRLCTPKKEFMAKSSHLLYQSSFSHSPSVITSR